MTTPPTWRDLGRRARQLGFSIEHNRHEATLRNFAGEAEIDLDSFHGHRLDDAIQRAMVAAALEQLEGRR